MINTQVNSWFNEKDRLSKVDKNFFQKGNTAFEKGDREELIDAITGLQHEERLMKDRWRLVNYTDAMLRNPNFVSQAFADDNTNNVALTGSRGAQEVVDNTNKIKEVKKALKKSHDKVFARREMLQKRLSRLDANVLPEEGAPEFDKIVRFSGDDAKRSFDMDMFNVMNPVLDESNGVLK